LSVLQFLTGCLLTTPKEPLFASVSPADWTNLGLALVCLLLAGCLATVRRSIARAVAERLRASAQNLPQAARRIEALLSRIDRLAVAMGVLEITAHLCFVLFAARGLAGGEPVGLDHVAYCLLAGAPLLWFLTDPLAQALAVRHGDHLLARTLTTLHVLQPPLAGLGWLFGHLRRGLMRLLRIRDDTQDTREIVADLRTVLADAEVSGNLQESEREIIGNVMDFRSEDVAALMTPRTAIQAADVEDGVMEAARVLASSGHSIIPIYEHTLDSIIGTISARDLVQLTASDRIATASLQQIVHPAYFVPETKRVSELLEELRRQKLKMAIVLDEYGGTAGLITVGDIIGELVGNIPDEYDEDEPAPLRHLAGGAVEIDASLHVSEVNEALALDLPEEADYETLGGFVLAELGHFPSNGESFQHDGHRFEVVDANDRRVLKVRVRRSPAISAP
jgi:putative hemolysin